MDLCLIFMFRLWYFQLFLWGGSLFVKRRGGFPLKHPHNFLGAPKSCANCQNPRAILWVHLQKSWQNLVRLELSLRRVAGSSNWTLAKRTTVFQMELLLRLDPLFGVLISHHRLLLVPFNHNYCGQCLVVGHEKCSSTFLPSVLRNCPTLGS